MTLKEELDDLQKKVETVTKDDVHSAAVNLNPSNFDYDDELVLNDFSQTLGEFVRAQQYMLEAIKRVRGHFLS